MLYLDLEEPRMLWNLDLMMPRILSQVNIHDLKTGFNTFLYKFLIWDFVS